MSQRDYVNGLQYALRLIDGYGCECTDDMRCSVCGISEELTEFIKKEEALC